MATEDNSEVEVHYPDGVPLQDEHFTFNKYEVFSRDAFYVSDRPEIDFTGTRVLATKPVSVYSGIGKANLYASVSGPDFERTQIGVLKGIQVA